MLLKGEVRVEQGDCDQYWQSSFFDQLFSLSRSAKSLIFLNDCE